MLLPWQKKAITVLYNSHISLQKPFYNSVWGKDRQLSCFWVEIILTKCFFIISGAYSPKSPKRAFLCGKYPQPSVSLCFWLNSFPRHALMNPEESFQTLESLSDIFHEWMENFTFIKCMTDAETSWDEHSTTDPCIFKMTYLVRIKTWRYMLHHFWMHVTRF